MPEIFPPSCRPDSCCFLRSWLKSDDLWKCAYSRRCLTSVTPASMAHRQPEDEELIENDSQSKCFRNWKKIDSDGEFWKWFFFSYWGNVLWLYAAASDGTGSTDCFRITNSSYEYVKWLNRENEVQMLREGERNENTHPPAMFAFVYQFYCRINRKVALL